MNKAYSYVRFSSEKQAEGDSLRRQLELAETYAHEHSLVLDTLTYRDLGISGFKSKNAIEGALGAFIEAVETNKIPIGSFLLVESLDRLSRDHIDLALEQFTGIIRRGITIVTLQDKQVYSKESIRENWTKLIIALSVMARANEESTVKGTRVKKAWDAKRDSGKIITKMAPAWLEVKDGKFKVIEKKAVIVRRIFQMAHDGMGTPSIARTLNDEKVPTMATASMWSFGLVAAILKNPGVIGTLTPKKAKDAEDIPDYYPKIVEPEVFNEVNNRVKSRKWKGGLNSQNIRNLFSGVCKCAQCGSSLRSVGSAKEHTYLRCLNAYAGAGCKAKRIPMVAVEKYLMNHWWTQGRFLRAMENREEHHAKFSIDPLVEAQNTKEATEAKIANLMEAIEAGGNIKSLAARLTALEEEMEVLNFKIEELKKPKQKMSELLDQANEDFFSQYEKVEASNDPVQIKEWRLKAQSAIRRFIAKIDFDGKQIGDIRVTYASGTVRDMDFSEYLEAKGFQKGNKNGKR